MLTMQGLRIVRERRAVLGGREIFGAGRWVLALGILALGLMPQEATARPTRDACISPGSKGLCKRDLDCCNGAVCSTGLCKRGCKIKVPTTSPDEDEDGDGFSDAPLFYENGDINPDHDCQWCQAAVDRFGWTPRPSTEHCTGASQGAVCDNDDLDHCDGTAPTCVDVYKGSETICRPTVNGCDVAEVCDGNSGSCTAPDGFAASTTPCSFGQSNGGVCDGADHCNGNAATCVDVYKGSETTCRPTAGVCDVSEACDGNSGSCPEDGFLDTKSSIDDATAATVGSAPGVYVCSGHSATPCDVSCGFGDCGEITMECGEVKYCATCKGESPPEATSNVAAVSDGTGVGGTASGNFILYNWRSACALGLDVTLCKGNRDPYRCCTGEGTGSCHNICLNSAGTRCNADADCATGWCECYGAKDGATNTCDSSGGMCRLPRITANCYFDGQCDAGIELHDSGARCREIAGSGGLRNCQPLPGQNGEACEFPWVVLASPKRICYGGSEYGQLCTGPTDCPGCENGACPGPALANGCLEARYCVGGTIEAWCRTDAECGGGTCVRVDPSIYCFEKMRCAGGTRNGAICSTIQLRSDGTADPDEGCPGCEDGSCGVGFGCNVDIDWDQVSSAQCESSLCARNAVATGGPLVTDGSVCCRDLGEACENDSDCCKGSGTLCERPKNPDGSVIWNWNDLRIRRCVSTGASDPIGLGGKVCKKVALLGEPCLTDAECWGPSDIVCTRFADGSGGVCTSETDTPRPQGASCSTIGDVDPTGVQNVADPKFFPCLDGLECRDCTGKENGWRCVPPEKICAGGTDNGKACGNPKYVCDGGTRDRQTCSPTAPVGAACPKVASTDPQPTCECISGCSVCPGGACEDNPNPGCCSSGPTFALGGQDFDLSNLSDPGECPNRTNPSDLGRCCNFGCAYLRTDPDNCGSCGNRCSEPDRTLEGGRACWVADDTTTCSEYECNYQFRCGEDQVCRALPNGTPLCVSPVLIAGTGIQVGDLPLFAYVSATGAFPDLAVSVESKCEEDSDCDNTIEYFCQKSCSLEHDTIAPPPAACTEIKGVCALRNMGICGDEVCDDATETSYKHDSVKSYCFTDCGYTWKKDDGYCDPLETCRSSILNVGTCDCGRCTIFDDRCD